MSAEENRQVTESLNALAQFVELVTDVLRDLKRRVGELERLERERQGRVL